MNQIQRKEQIYHAAEYLFSRRGYHATTMRELAAIVQIEGGSLYGHISGKYELLYTIVLRASEQFRQAAQAVIANDGSAPEQLRDLMRRHIAIVTASVERAAIYHHEWRHLEHEDQELLKRHRDEYEEAYRQIIRKGVINGVFVLCDERLVSITILSQLNWTYQWYQPEGALTADALADHFYTIVMRGLAPRNGSESSA